MRQLFDAGAAVSETIENGTNALHATIGDSDVRCLYHLYSGKESGPWAAVDDYGGSGSYRLRASIEFNDRRPWCQHTLDCISLLLDAGIDPNVKNGDGLTVMALLGAAQEFLEFEEQKLLGPMRLLVKHGANPNCWHGDSASTRTKLAETPLSRLFRSGNVESCRTLVNGGLRVRRGKRSGDEEDGFLTLDSLAAAKRNDLTEDALRFICALDDKGRFGDDVGVLLALKESPTISKLWDLFTERSNGKLGDLFATIFRDKAVISCWKTC